MIKYSEMNFMEEFTFQYFFFNFYSYSEQTITSKMLQSSFSNQLLLVNVPYGFAVWPNFHCFFVHFINNIFPTAHLDFIAGSIFL